MSSIRVPMNHTVKRVSGPVNISIEAIDLLAALHVYPQLNLSGNYAGYYNSFYIPVSWLNQFHIEPKGMHGTYSYVEVNNK